MELLQLQDLTVSNSTISEYYFDQFSSGNINVAHSTVYETELSQIQTLNSTYLNSVILSLYTLENNYYVQVVDYLNVLLSLFNGNISQLKFIGQYSSDSSYYKGNFVYYNNLVYMCIVNASLNILPTNDIYWLEIGLRGLMGCPNLEIIYKGEWDSVTNYSYKDFVSVSTNSLYVATTSNISNDPASNASDWELIMKVNDQPIYIEIPQFMPNGAIFISGIHLYLEDYIYLSNDLFLIE